MGTTTCPSAPTLLDEMMPQLDAPATLTGRIAFGSTVVTVKV